MLWLDNSSIISNVFSFSDSQQSSKAFLCSALECITADDWFRLVQIINCFGTFFSKAKYILEEVDKTQ